MALSLENALGRKIETLADAVLAQAMFGYVKYGSQSDANLDAQDDINRMSHMEFLEAISLGITELIELKILSSSA
jgi:hypothetical protein